MIDHHRSNLRTDAHLLVSCDIFCAYRHWEPPNRPVMQHLHRQLRSQSALLSSLNQHRSKFSGSVFHQVLGLNSVAFDVFPYDDVKSRLRGCELVTPTTITYQGGHCTVTYVSHKDTCMQDEREQLRRAKRQKRRAQKNLLRNWQSFCGSADWRREDEVRVQSPNATALCLGFGAVVGISKGTCEAVLSCCLSLIHGASCVVCIDVKGAACNLWLGRCKATLRCHVCFRCILLRTTSKR